MIKIERIRMKKFVNVGGIWARGERVDTRLSISYRKAGTAAAGLEPPAS